jgi:hypothetical protein
LYGVRALYVVIAVGIVATVPVDVLRGALAAATSTLLEALPFVIAAALAGRFVPAPAVAFAGCGCSPGPSARSIPAAFAVGLAFGPMIALGRFTAACVIARIIGASQRRERHRCSPPGTNALTELHALLPCAVAAGALQCFDWFEPARVTPCVQFAAGAFAGAIGAPCGIGAAALAASLHVRAPFAAAGMLCTAGIVDLRAFAHRSESMGHDAVAYATLAIASFASGAHRGAGFIHPLLGVLLLPCGTLTAAAAVRFRNAVNGAVRVAPAIMLAGVFAGSAPPQYRATETTMAGLFAGERLTFTGMIEHRVVIERYAITCCRADAMPVAVRCTRRLPFATATWVRADGTVVERNGAFLLDVASARRIAAPADPFVYR